MAGFLRFLVMPAVPTFILVAARSAIPVVRRFPAPALLSRYRFAGPEVKFGPRDLGR